MPRHDSPGKAKRAGIKSEGDLRRDEQLEEPMRGECSWCGTGYNGSATQVIAALAQHRSECPTWQEREAALAAKIRRLDEQKRKRALASAAA